MRLSPRTSTDPGYGPSIESYLSRCASVALSVMSFTATHSMSVSLARPARSTLRPMRPNPLIPTRTGMCSVPSAMTVQERGQATAPGRRAAPRAPLARLPHAAHELEPSAVGIEQVGGVIARRTERPRRGSTAVAAARGEPRLVGGVDGTAPGGGDREVAAGAAHGRAGHGRTRGPP